MPNDSGVLGDATKPVEPHLHAGTCGLAGCVAKAHGVGERRIHVGCEIGVDESQHVLGAGTQRASASEGRQIPVGNNLPLLIVAQDQLALHLGAQRHTGHRHVERLENPRFS